VDTRDLDALVELFIKDVGPGMDSRERDGSYETAGCPTGRESLRSWFAESLRRFGTSVLFVGNHVIDILDRETAKGVVYCKAEMEVAGQWIQQAIQYWDDYVLEDGVWRFAYRQHKFWYSVVSPITPIGADRVQFPAGGTAALPEAWPTWGRFWSQ
jgi:hypothetical protein